MKIPETKLIDIDSIKEDTLNPNVMKKKDFEALKKTIKKYGFIVPIITNEKLVLADGAHRLKAAKELGMKQIPTISLPITEVNRRILRQVMNKLKGQHEENADYEEYKFIIEQQASDDLMDLIPSYQREVQKIINELEKEGIKDEDESVLVNAYERAKKNSTIKLGEIYQLGNHRLMCGDATKQNDVNKLMNGNKADMIFTDPPWNVDYGGNLAAGKYKERKILNDSMTSKEFYDFIYKAYKNINIVSKEGALTYIVMSAQEWGNNMMALSNNNYHWSSTIIWMKSSLIIFRKDYHTQYEPIWYGWKEGSRIMPLIDRTQSDVWEFQKSNSSELHPTTKPTELCIRAIINSSKRKSVIIDTFGGSGSTLIACEQTDRNCYMMELDSVYCQVIINRWEEYTNKKAKKVS